MVSVLRVGRDRLLPGVCRKQETEKVREKTAKGDLIDGAAASDLTTSANL